MPSVTSLPVRVRPLATSRKGTCGSWCWAKRRPTCPSSSPTSGRPRWQAAPPWSSRTKARLSSVLPCFGST
eukprot:12842037-Alexandrium_andersonii.AAC.1